MKKLFILLFTLLFGFTNIQLISANTTTDVIEENDNEIIIDDYSDLAFLKDCLDSFLMEHPLASEKEQNEYLYSVCLSDEYLNRATPLSNLPLTNQQLNSEEQKLAASNPVVATNVFVASYDALAYTKEVYGYNNGVGNNCDAYRHGCWNILMTAHVGKSWAEKWGTAHEYGQSGLETQMDLLNNQIGRDSYQAGKTDKELATIIATKVNTGQMWRISSNMLVRTTGGRNRES